MQMIDLRRLRRYNPGLLLAPKPLSPLLMCIAVYSLNTATYAVDCLDAYRQQANAIAVPAAAMARRAVETYLKTGKADVNASRLPAVFVKKAAVFVTIAKNGKRRGCKGAFEPVTGSLRDEIIRTAIEAATADIRYRPIRSNELDDVTFTVSIVGPLKRVQDSAPYPPERYGLLLRSGGKSGVLLPGEAKTSTWRLAEARRQAGVGPGEPCELFVFETVALREPDSASVRRR